jgi:LysM repeat protein
MAKHRAPRYVRTRKVLAKAPAAAGATVVGLGVLSFPAQASTGTVVPVPAHVVERPLTVADEAAGSGRYTVQRGDTVRKIATAHGMSWRDLYQRNIGVIGANPHRIHPGQVLTTSGSAPAPVSTGRAGAAAAVAPILPLAAVAPAPTSGTARITNTAGPVKPQAQAAADAVVRNVPGAAGIRLGGTRPSATDPGGHPSGLAVDYMVMSDTALGNAIVAYHVAHWKELGVEYVIWQQRILTSPTGVWKAMANRGSATANHMDHPHVNYAG